MLSQDIKNINQLCFEYQPSLIFKSQISRGFYNFPTLPIVLISINAPKWRQIQQKKFHSEKYLILRKETFLF